MPSKAMVPSGMRAMAAGQSGREGMDVSLWEQTGSIQISLSCVAVVRGGWWNMGMRRRNV